jgi:hypothetical protein
VLTCKVEAGRAWKRERLKTETKNTKITASKLGRTEPFYSSSESILRVTADFFPKSEIFRGFLRKKSRKNVTCNRFFIVHTLTHRQGHPGDTICNWAEGTPRELVVRALPIDFQHIRGQRPDLNPLHVCVYVCMCFCRYCVCYDTYRNAITNLVSWVCLLKRAATVCAYVCVHVYAGSGHTPQNKGLTLSSCAHLMV